MSVTKTRLRELTRSETEHTDLFHRTILARGWDVFYEGPVKCPRMRIVAPSRKAAFRLLKDFGQPLEQIAARIGCWIGYYDDRGVVSNTLWPVYTKKQVQTFVKKRRTEAMKIHLPGVSINMPLLKVMDEILSSDKSMGLVRAADGRQMAVNGGDGGSYLLGGDSEHYSKFSRPEYWDPADLDVFLGEIVPTMQANSGQWTEVRYKVWYPAPGKTRGDDWAVDTEMVSQYRLIDAGDCGYFQIGRNVSMKPIAA